jgi:hypothetical protein
VRPDTLDDQVPAPRRTPGTGRDGTPLGLAARVLLVAFGVLTALAVLALLVGAGRTAEAFAWTIQPPLAAAFLGAAYGSGCVLVWLTLRAGTWEQARWPLATILVFVVLTLVATLLHLDRMHLPGDTALATAAGWFWMVVYVGLPPAMGAVLVRDGRRARRRDATAGAEASGPARRSGQPRAFTGSLLVQAAVLGTSGLLLLPGSGPVVDGWPWALSPFLAQVTAAWLLAFALAAVLAARVEVAQLGPAAAGYAAFGGLELLALSLHAGDLRGGWTAVAYAAVAAWVLATGCWASALAARARRARTVESADAAGGVRGGA